MDKQEKEVLNKRTTIHDVAHEAGVSMTTVSHALNGYKDVNEQTRQKIVEIARRLDYMPDEAGRSLRGIQKKTIALLIAGELLEEDPSGIKMCIRDSLSTVLKTVSSSRVLSGIQNTSFPSFMLAIGL